MGSKWGISKTMGQLFALLYVNSKPCNMEEIMEALDISRGNASMSLRSLIDWKIVKKINVEKTRKDYYEAEADIFRFAQFIVQKRREIELIPVQNKLEEISNLAIDSIDKLDPESLEQEKEFIKKIQDIHEITSLANDMIDFVLPYLDMKMIEDSQKFGIGAMIMNYLINPKKSDE